MTPILVTKKIPLMLLEETGVALGTAWRLVREGCFHSEEGCADCPLRCMQDEDGAPIENNRITNEDDPHYWDGCQHSEIPDALSNLHATIQKAHV